MKRIVDILRDTDNDKVLSHDVDASTNSTVAKYQESSWSDASDVSDKEAPLASDDSD